MRCWRRSAADEEVRGTPVALSLLAGESRHLESSTQSCSTAPLTLNLPLTLFWNRNPKDHWNSHSVHTRQLKQNSRSNTSSSAEPPHHAATTAPPNAEPIFDTGLKDKKGRGIPRPFFLASSSRSLDFDRHINALSTFSCRLIIHRSAGPAEPRCLMLLRCRSLSIRAVRNRK